MFSHEEQINALQNEIDSLHRKKLLFYDIPEDYFEPGEMEYLDQYDGIYDKAENKGTLCFEVKGTQYEGRTEEIERVQAEDPIVVLRDKENQYNANNFRILSEKKRDLGNMPADLCNAIAPLYDDGIFKIINSVVSFVEPISARSRYARKAVLFVQIQFCIM